jgi:superfamily II DNA or RNA helicase
MDTGGNALTFLREENAKLKKLLDQHGIAWRGDFGREDGTIQAQENCQQETTDQTSLTLAEKVAVFRHYFQGRQDVFARRWESSQGKSGYSPVCENEWRDGVCRKPSVKCSACSQRKLVPLTDQVIYDHLAGNHTIGLYPLFDDDTCRFLAIDFDEGEWKDDAAAFASTCREFSIPCALEISRSGKGAHVWIFFASSVPASEARRLASALVSRTCATQRQLELSSYDRFFPNQDRLPSGGFGNLIALPLQRKAREQGCCVFVNADFVPFPDQWSCLASIGTVEADEIGPIVARLAPGRDALDVAFEYEEGEEPWKSRQATTDKMSGPLPSSLQVVLADRIYLRKEELPQALLNRIIRLAAFPNPEFYKAQALRLPVWDKPRIIGCAENHPRHVSLPRGCIDALLHLLECNGIKVTIKDERVDGRKIEATFIGVLRETQAAALNDLLKEDIGVLRAPTAFGKTVVAAALIAKRRVSTLILVHRTELLRQWKERLGQFLTIENPGIGLIGGGKNKATGIVDIAVLQSLGRREGLADFLSSYGQIIVDECHHISAVSFEGILNQSKCRRVLGLTATPIRRDGLDPIIFMQCGPICHSASMVATQSGAMEVRARTIKGVSLPDDLGIQAVFSILATSEERNHLILRDIEEALTESRKIIVLTERSDHLDTLAALVESISSATFVLHGRMSRKQRNATLAALEALPEGAPRVVIATGKLIGEGFDHPSLDTMVLAMPISWKGTLQQYAGRLNRACEGKRDLRIYDYVEIDDRRLGRMWVKREKGYKAMGYSILKV